MNFIKAAILIFVLLISGCSSMIYSSRSEADNTYIVSKGINRKYVHKELGQPVSSKKSDSGLNIDVYELQIEGQDDMSGSSMRGAMCTYGLSEIIMTPVALMDTPDTAFYVIYYNEKDNIDKYLAMSPKEYTAWENLKKGELAKNSFIQIIDDKYKGTFEINKKFANVARENLSSGYALLEPVYILGNVPEIVPDWEKTKQLHTALSKQFNLLPLEASKKYNELLLERVKRQREEELRINVEANEASYLAANNMSSDNPASKLLGIGQFIGSAVSHQKRITEGEGRIHNSKFYKNVLLKMNEHSFSYIISPSIETLDLYAPYTRAEANILSLKKYSNDNFEQIAGQWIATGMIETFIRAEFNDGEILPENTPAKAYNPYSYSTKRTASYTELKNVLDTEFLKEFNKKESKENDILFLSLETFKSMKTAGQKSTPFARSTVTPFPKNDSRNADRMLTCNEKFLVNAVKNLDITTGLKSMQLK